MGFNTNGYVLRPARLASGNARSTGEATTGVDRDHIVPADMTSLGYDIIPTRPVEPYADMYRAAVLLKPDSRSSTEEYIIWAATTGSLSTVESDAFVLAGDPEFVTPAAGSITVGAFDDGTDSLFVEDAGGRDLASVQSLVLVRGDSGLQVAVSTFASQDPLIGRVVLDGATLAVLGGGFSLDRGDTILSVSYILASAKFWWSRNDQDALRFGWDGKNQKWAPFKGSTPQNVGEVNTEGDVYALNQPVFRFDIGDVLPGDPGTPDGYALLRAGVYPDSVAVPLNVLVVSNTDTEGDYPAAGAAFDAVIGVTNGALLLNPAWALLNAGLTIWYNGESFRPDANGDLGLLSDLPTTSTLGFPSLSPVPGPTERPFLRIGFRRYLTPIAKDTDADLDPPSAITERSFQWSRTTGKIVLSEADIDKSDPTTASYNIAFLTSRVFYDGVSLTTQPLDLHQASPLLNADGDPLIGTDAGGEGVPGAGKLFIQKGMPLPPPGTSGVLFEPDGTGNAPAIATFADTNARPTGSGLVRRLKGIGDSFIFAGSKAFENLVVEEYDDEIPILKIKVPKTTAVTAQQPAPLSDQPTGYTDTSRVQIKRRGIRGEALYFLQAQVTPSTYSDEARLYARFGEDYSISGSEVLTFAIDGTTYTWTTTLASGTYSAADIAASLLIDTAPALAPSLVGIARGRVFLSAADPTSGTVEIGWNADPDDLSGHSALGFLPAWRVDASDTLFRWQPDNGSAIGLYRSPENLDRSGDVADINAVGKFTNRVLTDSLPGTPFFNINNPPLEDIPGYDEGVHFLTAVGLNFVRLSNYGISQGVGVKYEWENDRIAWTEEGEVKATQILSPTDSLQLANSNVLPETFSSLAMAPTGSNFGLYLKPVSGTFSELTLGDDFLLPGNGGPGVAVLVSPEGGEVTSGGGGVFLAGDDTFSNPDLSPDAAQNATLQDELFATVEVGYLLEILNGDAIGFYTITAKDQPGGAGTTAEFAVTPDFPAAGSGISWRIYEAQTPDVYDPTIIADVQQVVFNHLPEEPFKIRLLSLTGTVGGVLTASVADAIESGRETQIRFGLTNAPAPQASISYLVEGTELGTLVETGLTVPVTDPHFTNSTALIAYFQIRVGGTEFNTTSANLSLVTVFSGVIPAGTIEVGIDGSGIAGEIRFADDVLDDQANETVYFDQLFLASTDLAAGEAEIDPTTGIVNLSSSDLTTYAGTAAYFVEQMITEESQDVTISPINGSIFFNKPLREFQIVEAQYQEANTDGTAIPGEISEFLPLIVRLEEGTLIDSSTYGVNPTGRTIDFNVESFIWAGVELQNYAGSITASLNPNNTVTFGNPVPSADVVKVNYGVLEAFGGEQAYTVSTFPVYRPPFLLEEEQTVFVLETDRTDDVEVGQLMIIGPAPFYVKAVSYDAGADATTVEIWPPPLNEAGSRAPGKDAATTLTSVPVALLVDPSDPVVGGGNTGFMLMVDTSTTPLLPVDRGQTSFTFVGDLRQFARAGHVIEVGGYPHIIIGSDLTADGRFTVISVSNPIYTGLDSTDSVYITARPVYIPNPIDFVGVAPFVATEPYTLVLFDADGVGTELVEGVHYEVDPANGNVTFKDPAQGPLTPGERLVALYTALNPISPAVSNDAVIAPIYKAKYLYITLPSETNRLLGSTLIAKYTYRNPDTFYYETLPLESYLAEVAQVALSKVSSSSKSGGPVNAYPGVPDNSEQGALGLRSEVQDLKDQDRAARAFIELYNNTVLAFEQVLEAMDGRVIGDRDGKFRFFIGHGKRYAPPGFEDEISGYLVQRLVWREIVDEWADELLLADGYYTEDDPVYDPVTAEEKDPTDHPGETDGKTPNPRVLEFYTSLQRFRIKNDMDDRLLIGFGRPRGLAFLFPGLNVPGLFKDMWQPHVYSRLFPERTKHFTRLFPGLEAVQDSTGGFTDVGFYSPGRKLTVDGPEPGETTEQTVRTRKSQIGVVANPAIGNITGLVDVTAEDRRPRARLWAYYPEGDAELDAALGITTVGKATMVATPLPLSEFPVDGTTGFPDSTQLLSQGGSLFDLVSGDADLSTPGFEPEQQVQFGTPSGPTGTVYFLTDGGGDGIFIEEVLAGCVLTLADVKGNSITGSDVFVLDNTALQDVISDGSGRGDTVFVGPPVADLEDVPEDGDSPTMEQIEELAKSLPDYRIQFDLKVGKRTGQFLDASLPTREDKFPLPLRNMFGQRPPEPMTAIEGIAEFVNVDRAPLKLPALRGLPNDDSGDVAIPYMRATDTELSVLGEVAAQFQVLLGSDSSIPVPFIPSGAGAPEFQLWSAIYPNEIVVAGEVYETSQVGPSRNPATMYAANDVRPVETAGSYTADSAIGDLRPWDMLLVETGQAQVVAGEWYAGMTGILSVGAATGFATNGTLSTIEAPRFVTPAAFGDTHKYTATNAFGYLGPAFPAASGVEVVEVVAGTSVLTLDFASVSGVVLDDGSGGGTGGILPLIGGGNVVVVNFYSPDPGAAPGAAFLGAILLVFTGGVGSVLAYDPTGPTAAGRVLAGTGVTLVGSDEIRIETALSMLALLPALASGTFYDYTITVDNYLDANTILLAGGGTVGAGLGSTTCAIDRDRLTFSELVSFASALPRGSTPANGDAIELGVRLNVWETTCGGLAGSSVNEAVETNGGADFTLQERIGPDPDGTVLAGLPYVGTFEVGTSTGRLRMMSWEGHGNLPLPFTASPTSGIVVAGVPTSDLAETSVILEGSGVIRDSVETGFTVDGAFSWIDTVTASGGALANVVAGDVVVVDRSTAGAGAVNCGTYLARHSVASNATSLGGVPLLSGAFSVNAGFKGAVDLSFPQVKSISGTTLTLQNVPSVPHSPTDCGFATTGEVYLINADQYATYDTGTTTYTIIPGAVYRASYSAVTYDLATGEATFTLSGTYEDATGTALPNSPDFATGLAQFTAAATEGKTASGMIYIPFSPEQGTGLPPNNVVGWEEDDIGTGLTAGVKLGILGNLNLANHGGGAVAVTSKAWDKSVTAGDVRFLLTDGTSTAAGDLGVRVPDPSDSTEFYPDRATSIYGRRFSGPSATPMRGVAANLAFDGNTATEWEDVHFDNTATIGANVLECFLPGDRFVFGDNLDSTLSAPGFYALSGLFLEPSFPRPTTDLALADPHVVAASWPLTGQTDQVGHRNFSDFDTTAAGVFSESVHFYVRRVRRWHSVQADISDSLSALQYTYEMRRGDYGSYSSGDRKFTAATGTYGAATNLGAFTEPLVNLNSGDVLRVLDADGNLIDTAEVQTILSATVLKLRKPGLTASLGSAVSFEVYLEQAIVPQEQSNEQLLNLVTDEVVFRRVVDYGAGDTDGGVVPTTDNTMTDTLVADWALEGVQEGDYVIVDPAGTLYDADEQGTRPVGDQSVTGRTPFVAGSPSVLDDNRGFYRVASDPSTTGADLEVDGASRFAGGDPAGSDDEVFGDTGAEYAVLPTITASTLTGGKEGQATLRLTAAPVGTAFRDRVGIDLSKSIQPFGYRIIRPSNIFSQDSLELILFMRERMLSFIEEVRSVYQTGKGGDYYVFQRDDHIDDVGSATDPTDGLGIVSNGLITSLQGLVDETPYANVSDCLSVLGRRFWILDFRLDADGYTDFVDDGFGQRPVLVDLIDDVLNLDDRFRDLRYSWISFRADQVNGSITSALRAEEQLPNELQKQRELIDQQKALESE